MLTFITDPTGLIFSMRVRKTVKSFRNPKQHGRERIHTNDKNLKRIKVPVKTRRSKPSVPPSRLPQFIQQKLGCLSTPCQAERRASLECAEPEAGEPTLCLLEMITVEGGMVFKVFRATRLTFLRPDRG